jgi:prepilin peptidase CpaA
MLAAAEFIETRPALLLFSAGLAIAAGFDVRTRRIPNLLCVAFLFVGLVLRAVTGGLGALALGLAGAAIGVALLLAPFALRLLGGGDVKLLGAIGGWLGVATIFHAALFGLALLGALSIAMMLVVPAIRRSAMPGLLSALLTRSVPRVEERKASHQVPAGAALAVGAILAAIYFGGLPHA